MMMMNLLFLFLAIVSRLQSLTSAPPHPQACRLGSNVMRVGGIRSPVVVSIVQGVGGVVDDGLVGSRGGISQRTVGEWCREGCDGRMSDGRMSDGGCSVHKVRSGLGSDHGQHTCQHELERSGCNGLA